MHLLDGLICHWEALKLLKKRKTLIFWGGVRFIIILVLFVVFSLIAFAYNDPLLEYIWERPESIIMLVIWKITLILFTAVLLFIAAIFSYIISQILFGVLIADYMSYVTEYELTTKVSNGAPLFSFNYLFFLIRQEIPRGFLPLIISSGLMILGWLLPLGFAWVFISSLVSGALVAWDYTDLVPARMLMPFGERFSLFKKTFLGHVIFGLPFLVPFLNVIFFSIGPVAGTIFFLKTMHKRVAK